MSLQSPDQPVPTRSDAGRQIAQLRQILDLVERIAGQRTEALPPDAALDEAALISSSYSDAQPIVQRRFDALAAETVGWAAAGVEALLGSDAPPKAAAARLGQELALSLERLTDLLRR